MGKQAGLPRHFMSRHLSSLKNNLEKNIFAN
jgi:hypothetical protein